MMLGDGDDGAVSGSSAAAVVVAASTMFDIDDYHHVIAHCFYLFPLISHAHNSLMDIVVDYDFDLTFSVHLAVAVDHATRTADDSLAVVSVEQVYVPCSFE